MLIAGPTASGKSALAIAAARAIGGIVINADSMQVYRDLRILTARPTPEDEALVPHALFGTVDGAQAFSVARWLEAAEAAIASARADNLVPVFTGGTGLYFKALTIGLSSAPDIPPDIRDNLRRRGETEPVESLHAELAIHDPALAARLKPGDRQRILRGLEVYAASGIPLSDHHGTRAAPLLAADDRIAKIFLTPERADLVERIDRRFDMMIAAGALDEVTALRARGLPSEHPVMRAHGVPGLIAYLAGALPLDAAIARGRADTRAYARRQMTWFRHQMPDFEPVKPDREADWLTRLLLK